MVLLTLMPPWGAPTVPIGLGYLSEFLEDHKVAHEVLDLNLEIFSRLGPEAAQLWTPQAAASWVAPGRYEQTLELLRPHLEWGTDQLAASTARLVGFSTNQSNLRCTIEAARMLRRKAPEKIIVFGGLSVFLIGERLLVPDGLADIFVIGEGELTLLRLVERLQAGLPLEGTTGTIKESWRLEYVPRPPVDLRHHPWPTYRRFQVARYPQGGAPFPVSLGRGCVCRCSFCGDYPFWGPYRSRRGADVVDELEHHVGNYGVHTFEFNDLAINGDKAALEEMCDGILDRGLDLQWSSYAYITRMSDALIDKLRRSGCVMLRFGMESGSDSVLRRMHKPHRAAAAADLLGRLSRAGIKCNIGLMAGFPQETDAEIDETIRFLRDNEASINEVDSLSVFYIKPLSYIEQHPEEFGILLPEDHHKRWNQWVGEDGSALALREARARRLMQAIEGTAIRFQRCNVIGM